MFANNGLVPVRPWLFLLFSHFVFLIFDAGGQRVQPLATGVEP